MSKREKLIERFRNNPKNVTFDEMHALLISLDYEYRSKGSHYFYTRQGSHPINIPRRIPFILPVYVKRVLDEIEND